MWRKDISLFVFLLITGFQDSGMIRKWKRDCMQYYRKRLRMPFFPLIFSRLSPRSAEENRSGTFPGLMTGHMCCFIRQPSYIHAIPYMCLTGRCTRNFTVQAFLRFIICRLRRIPTVWMPLWKRMSRSPAIFHLWVLFMWKTII